MTSEEVQRQRERDVAGSWRLFLASILERLTMIEHRLRSGEDEDALELVA